MFLEMRVGEGSHAERSPPDAGLGRRDSLDSSLPLVERLPSLDRFLPRFSAHTCPSGFNQPAKPVTRCVLGKRRQKEPRPPQRPGLPARRVLGRRGPWGLALKEHSGRGGGPAGRGGPLLQERRHGDSGQSQSDCTPGTCQESGSEGFAPRNTKHVKQKRKWARRWAGQVAAPPRAPALACGRPLSRAGGRDKSFRPYSGRHGPHFRPAGPCNSLARRNRPLRVRPDTYLMAQATAFSHARPRLGRLAEMRHNEHSSPSVSEIFQGCSNLENAIDDQLFDLARRGMLV